MPFPGYSISLVLLLGFFLSVECRGYSQGAPVLTKFESVGPYDNPSEKYRFSALPYCRELTTVIEGVENFKVPFRSNIYKQGVCEMVIGYKDILALRNAIKRKYYFEMKIDNLPVRGLVGDYSFLQKKAYFFNHWVFQIHFNDDRVIYANVSAGDFVELDANFDQNDILRTDFKYSVVWHPSSVRYEDRLNYYLEKNRIGSMKIHWLAILNSSSLVVLLMIFVAVILRRALMSDFLRYSQFDEEKLEPEGEYGWKLIHSDVFRYPEYMSLLCAFMGVSRQLTVTIFLSLIISLLNFSFYEIGYSTILVVYALSSFIGGYVSSSYYKMFGGENWVRNVVMVILIFVFPVSFVVTTCSFIAQLYEATSVALDLSDVVQFSLLAIFVGFPLTLFGGMTGKNITKKFDPPNRTRPLPRGIPAKPVWAHWIFQVLISSVLPFSTIYIELFFVFKSVWGHHIYTLHSLLFLIFVVLVLISSLVSICLTYFQLSLEDHQWWWKSFINSGSTGIVVFIYAFFYYTRSNMSGLLQVSFFFLYTALICYALFIMLGGIGFYASFQFVVTIYRNLKVD